MSEFDNASMSLGSCYLTLTLYDEFLYDDCTIPWKQPEQRISMKIVITYNFGNENGNSYVKME